MDANPIQNIDMAEIHLIIKHCGDKAEFYWENECMTCHQSNSSMTTLGPSVMNLNKLDVGGAVVWKGYLTSDQQTHLVEELRKVATAAPFRP